MVTSGTFLLANTGSVQDLTVEVGTTAIVNGRVIGDLLVRGTLVVVGELNGGGAVHAGARVLVYAQTPAPDDVGLIDDSVFGSVLDDFDTTTSPMSLRLNDVSRETVSRLVPAARQHVEPAITMPAYGLDEGSLATSLVTRRAARRVADADTHEMVAVDALFERKGWHRS